MRYAWPMTPDLLPSAFTSSLSRTTKPHNFGLWLHPLKWIRIHRSIKILRTTLSIPIVHTFFSYQIALLGAFYWVCHFEWRNIDVLNFDKIDNFLKFKTKSTESSIWCSKYTMPRYNFLLGYVLYEEKWEIEIQKSERWKSRLNEISWNQNTQCTS